MDKPRRDFHPGYVKRPYGCHRIPFTVELWNCWLARLNEEPAESLVQGIQQMRDMLEMRQRTELIDEVLELRSLLEHCVNGTYP